MVFVSFAGDKTWTGLTGLLHSSSNVFVPGMYYKLYTLPIAPKLIRQKSREVDLEFCFMLF